MSRAFSGNDDNTHHIPLEDHSADNTVRERRRFSRVETNQSVKLDGEHVNMVVELCNISDIGARIEIHDGLLPSIGTHVTLKLYDDTELEGYVVRVDGVSIGIEFTARFIGSADLTHHDHLGANYYSAVLRMQKHAEHQ